MSLSVWSVWSQVVSTPIVSILFSCCFLCLSINFMCGLLTLCLLFWIYLKLIYFRLDMGFDLDRLTIITLVNLLIGKFIDLLNSAHWSSPWGSVTKGSGGKNQPFLWWEHNPPCDLWCVKVLQQATWWRWHVFCLTTQTGSESSDH